MRAGLAAAALWLAAAGVARASPLVCSGGDTLAPLVMAWGLAAQGRDSQVEVRVEPQARLAAEGFEKLMAGQAGCAIFVREPFPRELAEFRARFGREPLLVPVARGSFATKGGTHAIAVFVNAANPVRGLTLAQLRAAFGAPGARTWGELGAGGAWAARPVHTYGMITERPSGDPPGIVNYLRQRMLAGAPFRPDLVQLADRSGDQGLAQIVRKVAEDPDGIGYSGFGYAVPGARAVWVAEGAGAAPVAGSAKSVADGRYPLSRKVYILADRPPGAALDPSLRALLETALSPRGQRMISADKEGFLPLTRGEAAAARAMLR
jgi:phosphate transport system substrate-binding protein